MALLWDVGGNFYIVYEVPGSQGEFMMVTQSIWLTKLWIMI